MSPPDNENGQSENPSPGRGDAAGELRPSDTENSPPAAPAAEASGAEGAPSAGSTVIPAQGPDESTDYADSADPTSAGSTVIPARAGTHPDAAWTRSEKLRAWEEKALRGQITFADLDTLLQAARRRSSDGEAPPEHPAEPALSPAKGRDQGEAGEEGERPPSGKRETSARRSAASRLNGQKSRGPVTAEGKQRVSQNLPLRRSPRLLGLAEARTLNQDPEAAEQLYRQLIEPYGPAPPPLLALHLQDLARIRLELEASERIRDAQLEARAEENDVERRRRLWELRRDLPGTAKEVFEGGLCCLKDSPAKFKRQFECLRVLKGQLLARDFDLEPILHILYGKAMEPPYDRSQTICIRCERLMSPKNSEPLGEDEFEELLYLVEEEKEDARTAYGLHVDEKMMTRSATLARLAPRRKDLRMDRRGDQLRRALDRKYRLIVGLLKTFGLTGHPALQGSKTDESPGTPGAAEAPDAAGDTRPPS